VPNKNGFRTFLWIILGISLLVGTSQLLTWGQGKLAPHDEKWAHQKQAEIEALDAQIVASKEAIARLDSSMKTRLISRSDDREEFNKLNEELLNLVRRRSEMEAELNSR